jgi:hypothetical protein
MRSEQTRTAHSLPVSDKNGDPRPIPLKSSWGEGMTKHRISLLAAAVLAVTSSLLTAGPAGADAADYHLSWFDTAEGTDNHDRYRTYQQVIDSIRTSEIQTYGLGAITPVAGVESGCGSAVPVTAQALCWKYEDNRNNEWIPQGITTSNDGGGGQASKIFVAWYDGCDTDDFGHDGQGCQNGPTGIEANDKGVRVSIYTPGRGYQHVLLVEPFLNSSHNPSFHATHMHGGGIALYGNFLYVADTRYGMRVFDTRQIFDMNQWHGTHQWMPGDETQVGRHDNMWFSHGYQWVWPAVGEWQVDGTADATYCLGDGHPLKFSYLSIDRASNNLVAGEYCPEPDDDPTTPNLPGRVARWQLSSTTTASRGLATGWAWDATKIELTRDHVQGLVSQGNTFYANASNGQSPGTLWKYDLAGGRLTNERGIPAAVGCEDLSYDTSSGRVYSLSEYYGKRAIYSVSGTF